MSLKQGGGREASKAALIAAARALFSEKGFEASSMRAIVKLAGTSIGNAYFYFDNKQALLSAVVDDIVGPRWEYSNRMCEALPAGVQRLAVSIYLNTLPGISGAVPEIGVNRGQPDHRILDGIAVALGRRTLSWLPDVFPDKSEDEMRFLVQAWLGVGKGIMLSSFRGNVRGTADGLTRRVIRWDLRAAQVSEEDIQNCMRAIDQIRSRSDWPTQLFDGPQPAH